MVGGGGFILQPKYKALNKLKSDSKTYWSRERLVKLDPLTNGPCETLWKGGFIKSFLRLTFNERFLFVLILHILLKLKPFIQVSISLIQIC